ncbi:MAG: CHASE2 domain-containing protein [Magnetococcus sp. YQC-5]
MHFLRRQPGRFLSAALLILMTGVHLWGGLVPLLHLRLHWFDAYHMVFPRVRDASPVIIVAVDEKSLEAIGQWPWPRSVVAHLLHKISAAGAVAIGVDLLWPEPDRLSPETWVLSQPDLPDDLRQALQGLPAHDTLLADAIQSSSVVLGVAGIDTESTSGPRTMVRVQGGDPLPFMDHYQSTLRSLPVLDRVASGHGLVSVNKDRDGVVRQLPLVTAIDREVMPSLGVEVLRLVKGSNRIDLSVDHRWGIQSVAIGDLVIPTTSTGTFWLHYTPHDPERFVSAIDVLSGKADEILNGRMVLLGVTGLGLTDNPVTSLHEVMPGVEVHAQFLENIFSGKQLQRPFWALWAEAILLGGVGLLLLILVPLLAPVWGFLVFLTLSMLCLGVGWWAYLEPLWLLDTAAPGVGGLMVYMLLLGASLSHSRQQKLALASTLEQERLEAVRMAAQLEAAQRIKDSEERVRLLMESVGEGVLGVDLVGCITFANPQASLLLGCSIDDLIGMNAHERFHHSHVGGAPYPQEACWWHKTMSDGQEHYIDNEIFWRLDGTCMDVEYRCTPVFYGDVLVGAVVSFSDITERKRIQRERDEALDVISSSIRYASRIQRSVLPDTAILQNIFTDYFIHWDPRDMVGGDMYWCEVWGDGMLLILGDCTGHGVPGAFMTLIVVGALGRAKGYVQAGDIATLMQHMHQIIQSTLGQNMETGESDDGIELGICFIRPGLRTLLYAGARFDLFIVAEGVVNEIKGNKKGIGYRGVPKTQRYDTHEIPLAPTSRYYLTTDGLIDQIGGENRRAFGKNRFKEILLSSGDLSMAEQKERIRHALIDYHGQERRRDDVSVIGFRCG